MVLALRGYQVRTAPEGPAALRLVQEQLPEVVLLDIGLPHMNGWEVARKLREQTASANKRPLLIAMSGYAGSEIEQRSKEAGIDLHLPKSVDMEELQRLLSRLAGS